MTSTDSPPVTATLPLLGTWLHDPAAPDTSIRQYQFGGALRDRAVDAKGAGQFYAGRRDPVVDYGEHEDESVGVTVHIPHGTTWRADVSGLRAFASAKRTLFYRDNRGRVVPGALTGFAERDRDWGTEVSFVVTRTDYPVTEVV